MRRKRSKRIGRLLFFIPVVVVVALVAISIVSYTTNQSGLLVVEALSSNPYAPHVRSVMLHVPVTIDAFQGTTPVNLTLTRGEHTVTYGAIPWYRTPPSRSILISGGKTEYAVTEYLPVLKAIAISGSGFNVTSVSALHGVTPVVWLNQGSNIVTLQVQGVVTATISPSQNYTLVFSSAGSFPFDIYNTQFTGVVQSA